MAIVDEYLSKMESALSNPGTPAELHNFVKEIYAVFAGVIPDIAKGLDLKKGRVSAIGGSSPNYDSIGDLRILRGKLIAYKETIQAGCLENPISAVLRKIDEDIEKCRRAIRESDQEAKKTAISGIVRVYENDIKGIHHGISEFGFASASLDDDLNLLIGKIQQHKSNILMNQIASNNPMIAVTNNAVASNAVSIELSITQVSKQIREIPDNIMSKKDKDELRLLLMEIEELRGAPKGEAESKIKKALLWIADKGVDAIIAAGPYLVSLAQSLI